MNRLMSVFVLILIQFLIFFAGIYIHPILLILIPGMFLLLFYLIFNPAISLLLMAIVGLVKGYITSLHPIFEVVDYTLLFTLITWIGLFIIFIKGELCLPNWSKKIVSIYILFCLVLLSSGFYTPSPNYGWLKIIRFIIFSTTMFITPFIIIKHSKDSKRLILLFNSIIITLALGMFFYVIFLIFSGNIFNYLVRVTVIGSNPITIGAYLAMGAGIAVTAINRLKIKYNIFIIPILLILLLSLLSTGSRGPTLGLFLGLFVYTIFFENNYSRKNRLVLGGVIIFTITVVFVMILPDFLTSRFSDVGSGDFVVHQGGIKRVSTIANRIGFWQTSIVEWSSSILKVVFGIGAGGFSSLYILRDFRHFPHNFFIEVLLETGLLGFILLLILFCLIWKLLFTKTEYTLHTSLWITATLVRFFTAQFSGDIVDNRVLFMLLSISVVSVVIDAEEWRFSQNTIKKD